MSEFVRYIHTQEQAQAELERLRSMARARYADRKQRADADQEASYERKRKGFQRYLFNTHVWKDADKKAKIRQAQKQTEKERSVKDQAELLNKIHQR